MIHDTRQHHFFNFHGPISHICAKSDRLRRKPCKPPGSRRGDEPALAEGGKVIHDYNSLTRAHIPRRGSSPYGIEHLPTCEGETRYACQSHRQRTRALGFA